MKAKDYLLLFVSGLFVSVIFAYFQSAPGYMDAEYYYAMGLRIARDKTFSEPFVWNYLNGFSGLPTPGFAFWMPLPAILAAMGIAISGWHSFLGARLGFVVIAGIIPILTSKMTYRLSGDRRLSILSGFFAILPAFYSPFIPTTDGFGIAMLLGAGFFLIAINKEFKWKFLILGILIGMMHLSRTDGFLWMIAGIFIVMDEERGKNKSLSKLVLGYFLVIGPWFARNWITYGNIFPTGSSKMLWLSQYDDLFLFNTELLNLTNWLTQGIKELVGIRFSAIISNLKTVVVVQWQIILFPLVLVGLINNRKNKIVQAFGWTWIFVFGLMSIVFPFAGARGGLFHSGAAFQPFFWTMAALGLSAVGKWGSLNRGWKNKQANNVLGAGLILILAGMSIFVLINRVIGGSLKDPQWNKSYQAAVNVGRTLDQLGVQEDTIVMINNPPGLFIAAERSAVAIPSSDPDQLYLAIKATGARYLILEKNHAVQLDGLYLNPDKYKKFEYLKTQADVHYFYIP